MAGEIFIARQDTLEDVQGTVNTIDTNVDAVNTTTTAIKSETESIKTDTEAIKLSTETIDQIVDTILERIGLTTDSGGGTTAGSIFAKLNALLSAGSGGITGFKYIDKTTSSNSGTTYTTQASGIFLTDDSNVYIESGGKEIQTLFYETQYAGDKKSFIGLFRKGAKIRIGKNGHAHIFEFI